MNLPILICNYLKLKLKLLVKEKKNIYLITTQKSKQRNVNLIKFFPLDVTLKRLPYFSFNFQSTINTNNSSKLNVKNVKESMHNKRKALKESQRHNS